MRSQSRKSRRGGVVDVCMGQEGSRKVPILVPGAAGRQRYVASRARVGAKRTPAGEAAG